jgi:hypothetical protein
MNSIELTPEDIQRQYNAAMDSVNLINGDKPTGMSDSEWADCLTRNKEHLQIMIDKDYWTEDQDLTPFLLAIED